MKASQPLPPRTQLGILSGLFLFSYYPIILYLTGKGLSEHDTLGNIVYYLAVIVGYLAPFLLARICLSRASFLEMSPTEISVFVLLIIPIGLSSAAAYYLLLYRLLTGYFG